MSDARCASTLDAAVIERLAELLAGRDRPFLVLIELDSGATIGIDTLGEWHYAAEGSWPVRFEVGQETGFAELVEIPRREFEDRLDAAAREHGLPPDDIVLAFPSVPLIRAVLGHRSAYMWRLALLWSLPSEVAELQEDIGRVAKAPDAPGAVRALAERLLR